MTTIALSEQMAEKSDAELLAMLNLPADWTPEALEAARSELQKRSIDTSNLVSSVPPPLNVPRRSYGALVWAGFLLLGVFSGRAYWFQLVCSVISVGVCVAWFIVSGRCTRRGFLCRFLGYMAFGAGSMLPLSAALLFPLGALKKTSPDIIGSQFVLMFAVGAGLIVGGFYLVFRRNAKVVA